MLQLALYVLGAPRLERDGVPVRVQRRKVMALLVYLAVTGKSQSRDTLAALFWSEDDQASARAALRRTLSELRGIAGENQISVNQDTVAWAGGSDFWLDAAEFQQKINRVLTHQHSQSETCLECKRNLAEAAALYFGGFLAGFTLKDSASFDEWMCLETESLRLELTGVLKQLAICHQLCGETAPAIHFARRWLELDQTDEAAHRLLMQLYASSGQRSAALRLYQNCAHILGFELGISPEEETTRLYDLIRTQPNLNETQTPDGSTQQHPASRPQFDNLPAQVTSFIGRQEEIEIALGWLRRPEVRLLTLTGPGGVGKTRLGVQIASQSKNAFEGVVFVSLAPLNDAKQVASAAAHSLGVRESGSRTIQEALLEALSGRRILLILDNFEHVLPAALLVSDLLAQTPNLKILVTSRIPLHVYGEHLLPVRQLSLPESGKPAAYENIAEFEGIRLFVDRAKAAQPGFFLKAESAMDVAEICRRLDGLPLAIELAASHVRSVPLKIMLAQLDRLDGLYLFNTLSNGPRDMPARHQTLHNAIAWSYDLLGNDEKSLFRCLGVFNGGCTLKAIEAVFQGKNRVSPSSCEAVDRRFTAIELTATLESLVDKSLLVQSEIDGELRYHMLEMVRTYALEKLRASNEEPLLYDRYAQYYLALAESAGPMVNNLDGQAWVKRLEREGNNFRAVLSWSLVGNGKSLPTARLKAAYKQIENIQIPLSEQRRWLEKVLALLHTLPGTAQENELKLMEADFRNKAGSTAYFQGDYPAAREHLEGGLTILRKLDDQTRLAGTLIAYSWTTMAQGDSALAKASSEESLMLGKAINAPGIMAHALNHLAFQACLQRDYDLSADLYNQSLNWFKEAQDPLWVAILHLNMGLLAQEQDQQDQARTLYVEGLRQCWGLTNRWGIGDSLEKVARIAAVQGQLIRAVHLFAAAETVLASNGSTLELVQLPGHEMHLAMARSGLEADVFAAAWAEGAAMPLEQAVAEALADS